MSTYLRKYTPETGPLARFKEELCRGLRELRLDWENVRSLGDFGEFEDYHDANENPWKVPEVFVSLEEELREVFRTWGTRFSLAGDNSLTIQLEGLPRHTPDFVYPYEEALASLLGLSRSMVGSS